MEQFVAELGGQRADPEALFFVMFGEEDSFEKMGILAGIGGADALAEQTTDNIAAMVTRLAEQGARRFLVVSNMDISTHPVVVLRGTVDEASEYQALTHAKLTGKLSDLESELDVEITVFDHGALSAKIMANPSDYGLTNVTDPCQGCESPDEYYFWDTAHLTRRANEIFGEAYAALYGQ